MIAGKKRFFQSLFTHGYSLRTPLAKLFATTLVLGLASTTALRADYLPTDSIRVFVDPASLSEIADGIDNGDVITFIGEVTPRLKDADKPDGVATWMTFYPPAGVEVVGAAIVDQAGSSYVPINAKDIGPTYEDCGSKGCNYPTSGNTQNGGVHEGQGDTGIFFSTDSATDHDNALDITGTGITAPFGECNPTGPDDKTTGPFNLWDYWQVCAFGTGSALSNGGGDANTAVVTQDGGSTWVGTGSIVAGNDSYYTNEFDPTCDGSDNSTDTFPADLLCSGPWQRIEYPNDKIGGALAVAPRNTSGGHDGSNSTGFAVSATGGHALSALNPLSSSTNAVRYVMGERHLGDIELGSITFRITDAAAFETSVENDEFCMMSTGGDTSTIAGRDTPWRYYEPEIHCADLDADANLLKTITHVNGNSSNGLSVQQGDIIAYQIVFSNTSGNESITNIVLSDESLTTASPNLTLVEPGTAGCPYPDDAAYNGSFSGGSSGAYYKDDSATTGSDIAIWDATFNNTGSGEVFSLAVGESVTVNVCAEVTSITAGQLVQNEARVDYSIGGASCGVSPCLTSIASSTKGRSLSGHVYLDQDDNGQIDTPTPIAGATVTLYQDTDGNSIFSVGDTAVQSTVTGSNGLYEFGGLDEDTYFIVETDPATYESTGDRELITIGGQSGSSDCGGTVNGVDICNLIGHDNGTPDGPYPMGIDMTGVDRIEDLDFLDKLNQATITGTVFVDNNSSCAATPTAQCNAESGESGYAGVIVNLYQNGSSTVFATTTTDSSGNYSFVDLAVGSSWDIRIEPSTLPPGAVMTTDNLQEADSLAAGASDNGNNFAFVTASQFVIDKTAANTTALHSATDPVTGGDTVTYTITPRHAGPQLLDTPVLTDAIPTGTAYVGSSADPDVTSGPSPLSWTIDAAGSSSVGNDLAVGGSVAAIAEVPAGVETFIEDFDGGAEVKVKDGATTKFFPANQGGTLGTDPWPNDWTIVIAEEGQDEVKVGNSKAFKAKSKNTDGATRTSTVLDLNAYTSVAVEVNVTDIDADGIYKIIGNNSITGSFVDIINPLVSGNNSQLVAASLLAVNTTIAIDTDNIDDDDGEIKLNFFKITGTKTPTSAEAGTTTNLVASPPLVANGDALTIILTVTSDTAGTVTPGSLTENSDLGEASTDCESAIASPVSSTILVDGTVSFTYSCNVTSSNLNGGDKNFDELTFSVTPTASAAITMNFATGSSNSVLTTPPVTFNVTVNNPINQEQIENTAQISAVGEIPAQDDAVTPVNGIIGDYIWYDTNGDGHQDDTEIGIEGVVVALRHSTDPGCTGGATNDVCGYAITTSDGMYLFTGVALKLVSDPPYIVEVLDCNFSSPNDCVTTLNAESETPPANTPSIGALFDDDEIIETATSGDQSPGANSYDEIYFPDNADTSQLQQVLDADFGYNHITRDKTIEDSVWLDIDNDGVRDGGEVGIPNVTLELLDGNGDVIVTSITNVTGDFNFTGVPDGDYTIRLTDNYNSLNNLSPTTSEAATRYVSFVNGQLNWDEDTFGYNGQRGSIGDYVWNDVDGDQVQDPGESGIAGVIVELYANSTIDGGTPIATTTTDSAGNYLFTGLSEGTTYYVSIPDAQPVLSGYTLTTGDDLGGETGSQDGAITIDYSTSPSVLTADFGFQNNTLNTLSGTVFEDTENNNTDIANTPTSMVDVLLSGVVVQIFNTGSDGIPGTDDDQLVATTTTDVNGDYSFVGLPDGEYTVVVLEETIPEELTDQTVAPPTEVDLDADGNNASAETVTNHNFIYQQIVKNAVTLSYFKAESSLIEGEVDIEWRTSNETDNAGFELYMYDPELGWIIMHDGLIPSNAIGGTIFERVYHFRTEKASTKWFALFDVDTRHQYTGHGPFTLDNEYGAERTKNMEIDWQGIRNSHQQKEKLREDKSREQMQKRLERLKSLDVSDMDIIEHFRTEQALEWRMAS